MYQERRLLYLYCETPLHAGSGSELGIVDLPIQRERHTGYPKVEASSLKGAVREHFTRLSGGPIEKGSEPSDEQLKVERTFGPAPDSNDANKYAGCLAFTDARLLCMPGRSAAGVWTWVTCPGVLARFAQDLGRPLPDVSVEPGYALVAGSDNDIVIDGTSKLVFEEYAFAKQADEANVLVDIASAIAEAVFPEASGALYEKLMGNLTVLHDGDFAYFAENATEVITRVRISQATGTVEQGALWTEEYLPSESILYSVALASGEYRARGDDGAGRMDAGEVMSYLTYTLSQRARFQLGGNATLGKGHLLAAFAKTSNA